jgi:ADP-heptose:LPS heptosyltransferase
MADLPHDRIASFTDLGDMAAFLKLCQCYVGNDGGPKHLAVAVGAPTVTVFQNDPWEYWTPPDGSRHVAVGGPNQSPEVDDVWRAVQAMLGNE